VELWQRVKAGYCGRQQTVACELMCHQPLWRCTDVLHTTGIPRLQLCHGSKWPRILHSAVLRVKSTPESGNIRCNFKSTESTNFSTWKRNGKVYYQGVFQKFWKKDFYLPQGFSHSSGKCQTNGENLGVTESLSFWLFKGALIQDVSVPLSAILKLLLSVDLKLHLILPLSGTLFTRNDILPFSGVGVLIQLHHRNFL
jgi:hypothetical protein